MLALRVLALHILGGFAAPSQFVLNSLIQDAESKFGLSSEPIKVAKPLTGNIVYELLETERKFLLNVPDNYVHGETHPLVFSFHGGKFFLSTTHYLKRGYENYGVWLTTWLFTAGGYSEKQQRITELSDPNLKIAGKPFLTAYAQGMNNTDWNMTHIWKGAPYENTTIDDVSHGPYSSSQSTLSILSRYQGSTP